MTISSDGQISFGVLLQEDTKFPWNHGRYDGEFEDWWIRGACGYIPPFEMFTAAGDWINPEDEHDKTKKDLYYRHRRAFEREHPCPVFLVNYCSYEYPMWLLCIGPKLTARRGYPTAFDPDALVVTQEDAMLLMDFCNEHRLPFEGEPKWWLSSLYG
jgi:hypothetical protein